MGTQHQQIGAIAAEIIAERVAQDEKWGEQNHPDGTGPTHIPAFQAPGFERCSMEQLAYRQIRLTNRAIDEGTLTWRDILLEEVFEALAESDPAKLHGELIQVAAVAAAWAECIDRRED